MNGQPMAAREKRATFFLRDTKNVPLYTVRDEPKMFRAARRGIMMRAGRFPRVRSAMQ